MIGNYLRFNQFITFKIKYEGGCMDHHHHEDKNTLTDPVCGMAVKETSQFYEKVDSKTFYFCSENCWLKFKNDPAFILIN